MMGLVIRSRLSASHFETPPAMVSYARIVEHYVRSNQQASCPRQLHIEVPNKRYGEKREYKPARLLSMQYLLPVEKGQKTTLPSFIGLAFSATNINGEWSGAVS